MSIFQKLNMHQNEYDSVLLKLTHLLLFIVLGKLEHSLFFKRPFNLAIVLRHGIHKAIYSVQIDEIVFIIDLRELIARVYLLKARRRVLNDRWHYIRSTGTRISCVTICRFYHVHILAVAYERHK